MNKFEMDFVKEWRQNLISRERLIAGQSNEQGFRKIDRIVRGIKKN